MRPTLVCALVALTLTLPAAAAPDPKKPPPPDDAADIADKLLERIDLDRFDRVGLRAVLDVLQEKLGYSILLDYRPLLAATGEDGGGPQLLDERVVSLPPLKKVRIETVLRLLTDQLEADFYIAADHVKLTTPAIKNLIAGPGKVLHNLYPIDDAGEEAQLERNVLVRHTPTVTATFKDLPLVEALQRVATRAGRTAVVSAGAEEKARVPVTVSLTNVPFETAVSSLAEAAGLRAYRNGSAVVIVTAERAKAIDQPGPSQGAGLCCSFGSGHTVTLEELEAIARLFPGAHPIDPATAKSLGLRKEAESRGADVTRLEAEKAELLEKVRKLTEELEKAKKK
jgi:hypothetical protein